MPKTALGRGLGALLGGVAPGTPGAPAPITPPPNRPPSLEATVDAGEQVQRIALGRIHPCPFQPRKDFTPAALQELADSIKEQGIVQPLIVRDKGDHYELIAGERRWRAAQLLKLAEVPVIVREADDRTVLELALIENLQRENLNPIEEAHGYAQLIEQFQLGQEEVSVKVGKGRATVANALRLLKLAPDIQMHIREGRLSVGHAKVILGLPGPEWQKRAVQKVLKGSLNVRQTEELVAQLLQRSAAPDGQPGRTATPLRDVHLLDMEDRLQQRLGTKVSLRYRQGKGALEIRFFSDEELERVLQLLGIKLD